MRRVSYTNQFRKDVKLASRRGYNMNNLYMVLKTLENEKVLDAKHKEHQLLGNYKGYFECHIEPDWLLIYKINGKDLYFASTGTPSDLF